MRSSIGATKIFTFYFILLYLFLKVKMCACSHLARKSVYDGDINNYDSDESLQSLTITAAPTYLTASPSDLGKSHTKMHHGRHTVIAPKIHHVRHEHHHVKSRHITQAQQAFYAYKSSFKGVNTRMDNHLYTSHHLPRGHHSRMHHHSNKNMIKHQNRGKSHLNSRDSLLFKSSATVIRTNKTSLNNISSNESNRETNSALEDRTENSLDLITTSTQKPSTKSNNLNKSQKIGFNAYSKSYFEELLHRYKSNSPYYKDYRLKDSSRLLKSFSDTKCNDKKCNYEEAEEDSDDYDYDYEEEEEDDDEYDADVVDNAEAQGDAGYSTTANPVFHGTIGIAKNNITSSSNKVFDIHANTQEGTVTTSEPVTERRPARKESHKTDASRLATFHAAKIKREGSCFTPKPKMILASNDPSKHYTPHCTILHRCGDDVGCCLPTQTCAASRNSTVHTVGSMPSIESLSFINHTECACFSRNGSAISTTSPLLPAPICACPSLFQRVIDDENRCICDCSSSDTQCDQFKRGMEHFSMDNRRCIKDGRCNEPLCEYGNYNKAKGKCPTREEKLNIVLRGS
ncbi:lateral signaling target protein 2 homolog isoform X2 [Armigeres subalbatus]|uniref:lateral signaling target protein 2 homolog isoform X2 n=1 Tax=Armigeres subalbatus TaxID=124917 RepID=UPI002ED32BF3